MIPRLAVTPRRTSMLSQRRDRGPTVATLVPQLYAAERTGAAPVYRRQGRRPVQTPGARADGAASGRQPGADDPRAGSIPSGMGRLLRLQPVAGAAVARRLGPTTPALRRLGPVEDARQAIPGTAPPKRPRTADERSYLQPQGSLADQLLRSPAQGLHQSSLPSSGFANHEARECLIRRTAVYGPVRTGPACFANYRGPGRA